MFELLKLSISF